MSNVEKLAGAALSFGRFLKLTAKVLLAVVVSVFVLSFLGLI